MKRYVAFSKACDYRFFDAENLATAEYLAKNLYGEQLHSVELYGETANRAWIIWLFIGCMGLSLWLSAPCWIKEFVSNLF